MRILLLTGWVLVLVIAAAWHYGPGQERVQLDHAALTLARADHAAALKQWKEADELYDEGLRLLPQGQIQEARRVRLERAKVQMQAEMLPTAHLELKSLVEELASDPAADQELLAESRDALANSQYYVTWLMRLEGSPRDDWEPEIEAARQNFSLLAEQSIETGDTNAAKGHEEDLESSIRLARMDLPELQGVPLPSQCKRVSSKKRPRRKPGGGKSGGKNNSNQNDARVNSAGPPPDTGGH